MPSSPALPEGHAELVVDMFSEGRVVPFLGAGVNLCDRPEGFQWQNAPEQRFLPSGMELAQELAREFRYPDAGKTCTAPAELCLRPKPELDLARISQYGDLKQGNGNALRETSCPDSHANFLQPECINFWPPCRLPSRTTNGRIHGTIDRSGQGRDGYVITEDHYIEYLAEEALEKLLPNDFLTKLRNNHLLFLGYSLRDWNLRVFLRRLKRNPRQLYTPWAVLPYADAVEEKFWVRQGVDVIKVDLKTYIEGLGKELAGRKAQPAAVPGGVTADS